MCRCIKCYTSVTKYKKIKKKSKTCVYKHTREHQDIQKYVFTPVKV